MNQPFTTQPWMAGIAKWKGLCVSLLLHCPQGRAGPMERISAMITMRGLPLHRPRGRVEAAAVPAGLESRYSEPKRGHHLLWTLHPRHLGDPDGKGKPRLVRLRLCRAVLGRGEMRWSGRSSTWLQWERIRRASQCLCHRPLRMERGTAAGSAGIGAGIDATLTVTMRRDAMRPISAVR